MLRIAASGVGLNLGDGLVVISGGTLALEITPAGLAGVIRATITVGAPGSALDGIFSVGATVTVMINQRTTAATFDRSWLVEELGAAIVDDIFGAGRPTMLPAGPYLRVEAVGIFVDVLGGAFRLTGDFAFEQATTAGPDRLVGTADDVKVVRIGLANVELEPRGRCVCSSPAARASSCSRPVAWPHRSPSRRCSPSPGSSSPGRSASRSTTGRHRCARRSRSATPCSTLDLPGGPYLRIDAEDIALTVAGQTLRGDFSFERFVKQLTAPPGQPPPAPQTVLKIAAANVELRLGDGTTDFVVVTEGTGLFLISPAGFAGELSANVAVNIPGVSVGGTFKVKINNTGTDIVEEFLVGGETLILDLPATPQLQISGRRRVPRGLRPDGSRATSCSPRPRRRARCRRAPACPARSSRSASPTCASVSATAPRST